MALKIPGILKLTLKEPRLGEALQAVQSYVNKNVTPVPGNKKTKPSFINPDQRPG